MLATKVARFRQKLPIVVLSRRRNFMICNPGWQLFARDGSPAACSAVSLFIVGCVLTHLLEARAVRRAFYRLAGIVKVLTAAVSLPTAVMLIPLIPKAIALPSRQQLNGINYAQSC